MTVTMPCEMEILIFLWFIWNHYLKLKVDSGPRNTTEWWDFPFHMAWLQSFSSQTPCEGVFCFENCSYLVWEKNCCMKWQKSPNQQTGLGGHSCSFRINLVSFRAFKHPLFPKSVSWLGLFCHLKLEKIIRI